MKNVDTRSPQPAEVYGKTPSSEEGGRFEFETLPTLLQYTTKTYHKANALNYPAENGWISYSHGEFHDRVRRIALGLVDLGLQRGETVGLVAPSSPDWIVVDLAIQIAGGVTVPIFNKISVESFSHEVVDSGMHLLFVGDPEEMPKAHEHARDGVRIISFGYAGTHEAAQELTQRGELLGGSRPALFDELCGQVKADDLATIIYTSGSTGLPKGVELRQRAIVSQIKDADRRFTHDMSDDVYLSILPLAHVFERTVTYYHISVGLPIYFADDPKKVGEYLLKVRPTIISVVPRVLQKIHSNMKEAAAASSGIKRRIAEAAIRAAEAKDCDNGSHGILDPVYQKAVYSRFRQALGGRLQYVISGSAKLSPRIAQFFVNIGIPIYEGYGLTEAAPVVTANGPGHRKIGTVGRPFDSVEVRIAEDGEVLARGPNIMRGYHNAPGATQAAVDSEGWLHTGDLGSLDDEGYLTITGRKKELFKKSTGEYVPPAPIEHELEQIPFVEAAIIFADNRVYVTAILFPDMEKLHVFKGRFGLESMSDREFLESDFLNAKAQEHITEINRHRHHCEWIERFHIADHSASPETGEMTPTLKLRRHVIEERYAEVIEEMYASIGGTK